MADLRALLEGLGLTNVRTYLQSGNAVFDASDDEPPAALAAAIEARIERDLGPQVGVLVLSGEAMADAAAANPFLGGPDREGSDEDTTARGAAEAARQRDAGETPDESILHATFLFGPRGDSVSDDETEAAFCAVCEAAFGKLALPAADGEAAAFVGAPPLAVPVVYLKLPHGYGRTKLNNAWFERKLGTAATTRNWRTVLALADMAGAED
jgi:uncharacterized protein (DUF1697 family)